MGEGKPKINGSNIAGGNPLLGRVKNDFYATAPKDTLNFLTQLTQDGINLASHKIIEPCAGAGHITDVLTDYYPGIKIDQYDLNPQRGDIQQADFLLSEFGRYDTVLTNPPFKIAQQIITRSLEISDQYVMMFLKLQFLEGVKRKEWHQAAPLKYIYVYSYRASPWRNGEEKDPGGKRWASTMAFAWYVYEKGYTGEPVIRWI